MGFLTAIALIWGIIFLGDFRAVAVQDGVLPPGSTSERGDVLSAVNRDGALFQTRASWDGGDRTEVLRLHGDQGTIDILDLKAGSLLLTTSHSLNATHQEAIDVGPLPFCHWGLMANTNNAIRGSEALVCSGEEGRKSTVIMDQIAAMPHDGQFRRLHY